MNPKAVLIIGASGRTGLYLLQELHRHEASPEIFAFCRDPSKMDTANKAKCQGVLRGNARDPKDIERALEESDADMVFISIGNGDDVGKSDIRTASATALVQVLAKSKYQHVRAMVVSSTGSGGSRIKVGFGIGMIIERHLRHVLKDHNGQEAAFLSKMKNRTMIVRPTALTENEPTGKVIFFGNLDKSPTIKTDRQDLAEWIVKVGVYGDSSHFGSKPINITCAK